MPKVKRKKSEPAPEVTALDQRADVSVVLFGIVMVISIIIALAALFGGSMSHVSKRWGGAMDGLASSVGLSVTKIETIGLEHDPMTMRQIEMAAMIEQGENMFRADPHLIRSRVEATNLVTNVRVYRLWPDTVIIRADSADPVAIWEKDGREVVIDSLGREMKQVRASDYPELVRASGLNSPAAISKLAEAFEAAPNLSQRIIRAERVSDRRWNAILNTGQLVKLPGDEDLVASLSSYERLNDQSKLSQRGLAVIDLRVNGRVFMTQYPSSDVQEGA